VSERDFAIRRATIADAAGVLACLQAAFEPYRKRYTEGAFRDTVPSLRAVEERLTSMAVFVAVTAEGAVAGTVAWSPHGPGEGHLRGMAVLPGRQGRGIAARLLEAAEDEARRAGCLRMALDTTEPLERAIRFYERHGYRPTGTIGDFYGMDLFEYARPLRPPKR